MEKKIFKKLLDKTNIDEKMSEQTERLKKRTSKFEKEVRKNIITAILAAFAFIIALVWRDVIQEGVNKIIAYANLSQDGFIYKLLATFIITIFCVIGIMFIARFEKKEPNK